VVVRFSVRLLDEAHLRPGHGVALDLEVHDPIGLDPLRVATALRGCWDQVTQRC
jgi:hypothetical protein